METKFEFAKQIVQEAAAYILAHMQEDLQVKRKSSCIWSRMYWPAFLTSSLANSNLLSKRNLSFPFFLGNLNCSVKRIATNRFKFSSQTFLFALAWHNRFESLIGAQ